MDVKRLHQLIDSYYSNQLSRKECEELLHYLNIPGDQEITEEVFGDHVKPQFDKIRSENLLIKIKDDPRFSAHKVKPVATANLSQRLKWTLIAASLLIFVSVSLWFYSQSRMFSNNLVKTEKTHENFHVSNSVMPGDSRATLTLSSGKVYKLNSLDTGILAYASNTRISNSKYGMLVYQVSSSPAVAAASFSTVATPRGGEYKVLLPDGTRVWLNSASSIRFSSTFKEKIRRVQLTGEAYFEVAKNKHSPFHVEANGVVIKVLGTHFNVSCYHNGTVKTSLVEGSVIVEGQDQKAIRLKPGQQAVAIQQKDIKVFETDVDKAIAWKNGFFKFQDEDIRSIMEEVARWYDIEVEFKDNVGQERFGVVFSKSKSLSELLASLETVGSVRFKTEGRRVTVMK